MSLPPTKERRSDPVTGSFFTPMSEAADTGSHFQLRAAGSGREDDSGVLAAAHQMFVRPRFAGVDKHHHRHAARGVLKKSDVVDV